MTTAWKWWAEALDNPGEIGKSLRMSPDSPETGYFKTKLKNGAWEPVVLWEQDGRWHARRNGEEVAEKAIGTLWNWCCRYPITTEEYDGRMAGDWAGDDPTVVSMIGHNAGDDLEMLRDQIEAARQGAEAYANIENDEQAAKAQSLRARLNELGGNADKRRKELKDPHLKAGKAIDEAWMPLVKEAEAVTDMLRKHISAYETAKLQERQREERRRLAEEERVQEQIRRAEEAGRPVVIPEALPPLPTVETTIKGSYGRAASLTVKKEVTAITDQDKLYQYLRGHEFLKACLLDLARKAVRAGDTPPGVEIQEVVDVR